MANVLVEERNLQDIADAIREKNGTEDTYKPAEMGEAIRGISGQDWFKYATTLKDFFRNSIFEDGTEVEIDCRNGLGNEIKTFESSFQNAKGLKKLTLSAFPSDMVDNMQGYSMYMAFNSSEVEILDLSGIQPLTPRDIRYIFYNAYNLKEVIGEFDLSLLLGTGYAVYAFYCSALEEIRFKKETINAKIEMNNLQLLSDESIQSIIDGLVDLTDSDAQTITFHADVKAKLTDEQIATITSKNWTLA